MNRSSLLACLVFALAVSVVLPEHSRWLVAGLTFAVLISLVALVGAPKRRCGEKAIALWAVANAFPGRAILGVAFAATLIANYPVLFGGKSLVSPNLGSALLYGQNPWVPGNTSKEQGNASGADIDPLMWHHLPLSMIEHRALFRDGELPLWNRYDSAGTPLLGQGQSCFGDPLQLIPLLANGAGWAWDAKLLLAKLLLSCGIGFCVWRMARHLPSALLLAASVQFIGFFVYRINHPAIFSLCYSPWILYCWLRIVDSRSARPVILWALGLVAVNLTEMNSGTVKEAYILLLSLNFSGACVLAVSTRTIREKAKLLAGAGLAGVVFALIGSPVWLTFVRALKGAYTTYDAPSAFQLQPGMLIGLFDEAFYRPFQIFSNVINPSANILILVGLLWCVVRWRSVAGNRVAVGLAASSIPALLLAFGVIPPGLITRIPFLGNILHVDNTFSCVLIVIVSVLAGLGWKEAWERLGTDEGKREAVAVVALLLLGYAAYLGTAQAIVRSAYVQSWGRTVKVAAFVYLYGASLVAASALLLFVLHGIRRRNGLGPASAVYLLLALAALHWRGGLQAGLAYPDYVVLPTNRVNLQAHSPTVDAISSSGQLPARTIGFLDNFFPGWSIVYGLEGINGPDALVNPYYRELMGASGIERVWDWRYRLQFTDLKAVKPFLDLLNVRFYVDYPAGNKGPGKVLTPFLSADMESFESKETWPRAFFTDSAAVYSDLSQYASWIRAGDGRPFAAVQLSDWLRLSPVPQVSGHLENRRVNPASDYRLTTNSTSFTVSATGPGFIVLTEAFEPGNFRATVDGQDVPYLRLNHAFKGVYVDAPGTYLVTFSYWPRGFTGTLYLSALGSILAAIALVAALRMPKEPQATI